MHIHFGTINIIDVLGGYRCEPRRVASDLSQFEIVRIKTPSGSVSLRLWHAERVFGGYLPSPSDSKKLPTVLSTDRVVRLHWAWQRAGHEG